MKSYTFLCVVLILLLKIMFSDGKSIIVKMEKDKEPSTSETTNEVGLDEDVAPPNHLDAMKFNRDGSLNTDFHKEVFLGEDVENFENGKYPLKEQKKKLEEIFHFIDVNNDKHVVVEELSAWVLAKTKEHFDEAKEGNGGIFAKLDTDNDERLEWNEYLTEFLGQKGLDRKEVAEKLANKTKIEIEEKLKYEVDDLRDKWIQAGNKDNKYLNSSQFLDFQHPELSQNMLALLVEDFLHDMDQDNDNVLTIHEYMAMASNVDVDRIKDDIWATERRDEFRNSIDVNEDGKVTKEELSRYLDPLSKYSADQEARQLISFGDENGDNMLSLKELMKNSEYYTGSKLYDYAKNVHEEF